MSAWAALAGGAVGTVVLTTMLRGATEARLTRIDLPFLLGTAFTADRRKAKILGYALHFVAGLLFSIAYFVAFVILGQAGWLLGAAFGVVHGMFAGGALVNILLPVVHPRMGTPMSSAASENTLLEPPGFMMLNYGSATPVVGVLAHIAFGAIVGGFIKLGS